MVLSNLLATQLFDLKKQDIQLCHDLFDVET